jgi:hypothetical protein
MVYDIRNKLNSRNRFKSKFSGKSGAKHLKLNESEVNLIVGQGIRYEMKYKKQESLSIKLRNYNPKEGC